MFRSWPFAIGNLLNSPINEVIVFYTEYSVFNQHKKTLIMENFPHRIQRVINEGYDFRFEKYLNQAFSLVNKDWGIFVGFAFMYLVLSSVIGYMIAFMPMDFRWPFELIKSLLVEPCLIFGFFIVAKIVDENRGAQFDDFFGGFQHWKKIVTINLIQTVVVMIPAALFTALFHSSFNLISPIDIPYEILYGLSGIQSVLIGLAIFLPIIYLMISWYLAVYIAVFYDMRAWDAMEASRRITQQKFGYFLAFGIVVGIIVILGGVALLVGIFYTIPVGMVTGYILFKDIIGFPDQEEGMDIMDHLILKQ